MGCNEVIETKLIRIRIDTYDNLKALKEPNKSNKSKKSKETFDTVLNRLFFSYRKRTLDELEYKNEIKKHYVELLLKTLDDVEM